MSSRIHSDLGTLGERSSPSGRCPPGTAHVEVLVDGRPSPGLLAGWQRGPSGWLGHVAWVQDGELVVGLVEAARVRPV